MMNREVRRGKGVINAEVELHDEGIGEAGQQPIATGKTNRHGRKKGTPSQGSSEGNTSSTRHPVRNLVAYDDSDDEEEGQLIRRSGKEPANSPMDVVNQIAKNFKVWEEGVKPKTRAEKEDAAFYKGVAKLIDEGYESGDAFIKMSKQREAKKSKAKTGVRPEVYYDALLFNGFKGTLYPHQQTMELMGIHEDVELMLGIMGVSKLTSMVNVCYKEETAQFLSTLSFTIYEKVTKTLLKRDGGGSITFSIHGESYTLTLKAMQELLGFSLGMPSFPRVAEDELNDVWKLLSGDTPFVPSRSKGNRIRNPAINYVRRAMGAVLFARPSPGPMNLGEMEQIDIAMFNMVGTMPNGRELKGDEQNSGLAGVFAQQLSGYKKRALQQMQSGNPKAISIGGSVTPILMACGVRLNEDPDNVVQPRFLDVKKLQAYDVLSRSAVTNGVLYNLYRRGSKKNFEPVLLPCPELSTLEVMENLEFNHPLNAFRIPEFAQVGASKLASASHRKVTKKSVKAAAPEPTPRNVDEGSDQEEPENLYFDPYNNPKMGIATKEAHKHIGKLQKMGKWLVKKVRGFTKESKEWAREREELKREIAEIKQRFSGELHQEQTEELTHRHSVSSTRTRTSAFSEHYHASSSRARHSSAEVSERMGKQKTPSKEGTATQSTEPMNEGSPNVQPRTEHSMDDDATNLHPVLNSLRYTYEDMNESIDQFFYG